MGASATRAWIARSGDYYWCPLGGKQMPAAALDARPAPILSDQQPLEPVYAPAAPDATTPPAVRAEGYVVTVALEERVDGRLVAWSERRLVVRSVALADRQGHRLDERLDQALAAINRLNERKQGKKILDAAGSTAAVEQILQRHRVTGLIHCDVRTTTEEIPRRRHGARPAETRIRQRGMIAARLDAAAVAAAKSRLGWRVYATNHPALAVAVAVAIDAYRGLFVIEGQFGRFKGRSLSLTPLYLQSD